MTNSKSSKFINAPVAIGCIGGSGSRGLCNLLINQNFHMGNCLNQSEDNLWFSLLFKRLSVLTMTSEEIKPFLDIFIKKMIGNDPFTVEQLNIIQTLTKNHTLTREEIDLAYNSLIDTDVNSNNSKRWGWKEPNTHLIAAQIHDLIPEFKFIYLSRNSLDMAYSDNQNQLMHWGEHYLGESCEITPTTSLKYWIKTHKRMIALKSKMQNSMYIIDYDSLCKNPKLEIEKLNKFLDIKCNIKKLFQLKKLIVAPSTVGRYKKHNLNVFDNEDLDYVKKLGHLD